MEIPVKAGRREWVGLAVLALACLLYVMDLTVLHFAVPALSADLRPSSVQLLWIIDVYGFMVAGALVTMGTLGDRIGRRRLLLVGAAAFGLMSVVAAFSTSPEMLIASRALLGLAGATIAPSTLSLIFHMFRDPRERSTAVAVWIGAFSAGSAIGPVLGGLLLSAFWWGSVFLLALPVMALLLVLGPRVLPEYRDPGAGRLDVTSAAMSVVALLAVVYGLKHLAQDGLGAAPLVAITTGAAVGVLWARRQRRLADPMIDVSLFRIRAFNAALAVNFMSIFMMIGYFLFVAQYLQLVLGQSPLEAGLWSLPSAVAFVVASQVTPWLAQRVAVSRLVAGGLAIGGAGLLLLLGTGPEDGLAALIAASVVISVGIGPVFGLTTELIVGSAPPEKAGAATGVSETASELGGALGLAVLGSIGVAVYRGHVTAGLPAGTPDDALTAVRDTLGGAVDVAAGLAEPLASSVLAVAREGFVAGLHLTAVIAAGLAAVLVVLAAVALRPPAMEGAADCSEDNSEDGSADGSADGSVDGSVDSTGDGAGDCAAAAGVT